MDGLCGCAKNSIHNEHCAAGPPWTARCRVLGRARISNTSALCVLASHSPRTPRRRVVILNRVLRRSTASAHAALLAVVVVWASAFSVIKALLDDGFAAEDIALLRYLVAAPGFAFLLWRVGGLPGLTRRDALRLAAVGVCVVVGYHISLNVGTRYTTSGTAALVIALSPALTLLLAVGARARAMEPAPGRRPRRRLRRSRDRRPPRRRRRAVVRERQGPADRARRPGVLRALQRAPEAAPGALRPPRADGRDEPRRDGLPPALPRRRDDRLRLGHLAGGRRPRALPRHRLHVPRLHRLEHRAARARRDEGGRLHVRHLAAGRGLRARCSWTSR